MIRSRQPQKTEQAILLVAGRGSRLAPLTDTTPKCLLHVGDEPLLLRLLKQLKTNGISRAVLVTGYLNEKIEAAVEGIEGLPEIVFAYNDAWNTANNAESLRVGMQTLGEGRFILLDGDLLICDDEMIADLLADRRDNVLGASLQLPRGLGEEEMKFQLEPVDVAWYARRVVGLSKKLDPRQSHGESMGMQIVGKDTFSPLLTALGALSDDEKKTAYYEDVFADLIREQAIEFFANAVDPASWIEIDTEEDLSQARSSLQKWQVSFGAAAAI